MCNVTCASPRLATFAGYVSGKVMRREKTCRGVSGIARRSRTALQQRSAREAMTGDALRPPKGSRPGPERPRQTLPSRR